MRKFFYLMSIMLTIAAVLTGGGVMAVTIGDEGPEEPTKTDPANKDTNDREAPGDKTAGQALDGTQASSTQERKGGLIEDEWDSEIVQFRPWNNPLLSIARKVARKVTVQNWTIKHPRNGGESLKVKATSQIAGGTTTTSIKLINSGVSANVTGSLKPFYKGCTVICPTVQGYKEGNSSKPHGNLVLFVTDVDSTGVTMKAINGPLNSTTSSWTGDLSEMSVPTIPSGSIFLASASAGSESQLMITPENYQPRYETINVQKKLLNIVFTEDFDKVKKKFPFKFNDIRSDAMYKYNLRAERNYWMGTASRFSMQNADGSVEDVYTSEGILTQVTNSYAIGDEYTLADLIAISKIQFTDFSQHNTAYGLCGKNAMARLLNINPGNNRTIMFEHGQVEGLKLDFKSFTTTFGKIDFIWDQGLDEMGMQDCMVILDLAGATRYVKIGEKEQTNDMSKGAGEIRDAKRFIHYEADAIALRGYNSIIVGPSATIFGLPASEKRATVISAPEFPASPSNGTLVALTKDFTLSGTTYSAGKVYQYATSTTSWSEWSGTTHAV